MKAAAVLATIACALAVAACKPTPPSAPGAVAALTTFPTTLEGEFRLSVEKGPVDDKGVSEANFGTLTANGADHLVQVSGAVLAAAGLPREGGKVRATLGSKTDAYGPPTYIVTALDKL